MFVFSRWRFTFYLSIFFYGIRFLWTVSCSVTHVFFFCVLAVEWCLIWDPGGSVKILLYTFLYRSVIFGNDRKLFDVLPQNAGKNKVDFVIFKYFLLWRAAPFFSPDPLEGIQVHLLESLLLLELYDRSRNFHCSRTHIDSTN